MPDINWESFTPLNALIGGGLIGLAAAMLMAFNGRIMGASGILAGLLPPIQKTGLDWRIAFVIGTVVGPFVVISITGAPIEMTAVSAGLPLLIGGFLVGFGAAIGSGCTSGHGICGLARLSPRSLVAVCVFMASAVLTVAIINHGMV